MVSQIFPKVSGYAGLAMKLNAWSAKTVYRALVRLDTCGKLAMEPCMTLVCNVCFVQ
jgi:hypothetical protein